MFSDLAVDTAVAVGSMLGGRGGPYWAKLDTIEDLLTKDKSVKSSAGCYRRAFVFGDFVIKVSRTKERTKELQKETDFIAKMKADPKYGRHFPDTLCLDIDGICVQVQEKVDTDHRKNDRGNWRMVEAVEDLAIKLGIEDCHEGNYGWAGPADKEFPVFIDVDFRASSVTIDRMNKRRSWMV